jgi:elongation factor P--beta-lysine ligase
VDVLASVAAGKGDRAVLAAEAANAGVAFAPDDSWADVFSRILVERVDPRKIDAALIGALKASGIALGFDRLVMLATGASRIDQVLWAPVAEYGR